MTARILKGSIEAEVPCPKGHGEVFMDTAEKYSDEIFQIDAETEQTETWGEFKRRAVRLAIYLRSIGIKPGDVVLTGFPNNMDAFVSTIAAFLIGARFTFFAITQDVGDIEYILSYIEPNVIIIYAETLPKLEAALTVTQTKPMIIVSEDTNQKHNYENMLDICSKAASFEDENLFRAYPVNVDETAYIYFSSGTTNLPKGICLTHRHFLTYPVSTPLNKSSVLIQSNQPNWLTSGINLANAMRFGCKRVIGKFTTEQFYYFVEKYKIQSLLLNPKNVNEMIAEGKELSSKYNLASMKCVMLGGTVFNVKQISSMKELFSTAFTFSAYGSTELAGSITSFRDPDSFNEKTIASSGQVMPNVQIKIVNLETRELLPPNQVGELLVKSSRMMKGFYKKEAETLKSFDEEDYLKTGDLAYYDENEFVYFTGRVNETFHYRHQKVSPRVIEDALKSHPSVEEAVVFGLPHDVDKNHPAACVQLKRGAYATEKQLREFSDSLVTDDFKLRGGIRIIDDFPKTPSGKIQRRLVEKLFEKHDDYKQF